jgi:hypothetical protein
MSHRRKVEHKRKLRIRRFGVTETVGEEWLLDDTHEAGKSNKREEEVSQYGYSYYVSESMARNWVALTKLSPAYMLPFSTLTLA